MTIEEMSSNKREKVESRRKADTMKSSLQINEGLI